MDAKRLYIELLKKAVRNQLYGEVTLASTPTLNDLVRARAHIEQLQREFGSAVERLALTPERVCHLWAGMRPLGHTLCDDNQLNNVQECVERVLRDNVAGDLIEAGVYRGGQCIFMRGLLAAHGVDDRRVFVADSFRGLPTPCTDIKDAIAFEFLKEFDLYRVDANEVRRNFARYGLLDENVVLLEGWFGETLPNAPIERIAIMRLDGDFYESTRDALESLYPKLSIGGFAIIDDYGLPVGCRRAVDEYRSAHGIGGELSWVNGSTVFWRKTHGVKGSWRVLDCDGIGVRAQSESR